MECSVNECGVCASKSVVAFCENCNFRICTKCFEGHKKSTKSFKNHVAFLIESTKLSLDQSISGNKVSAQNPGDVHTHKCATHTTENLVFFCTNHSDTLCGRCVFSRHKSCKVVDLFEVDVDDEEVRTCRSNLHDLEIKLKCAANTIEKNTTDNKACKQEFLNELQLLRNEVNTWFDYIQSKCEKECRETFETNTDRLTNARTFCNAHRKRIQEVQGLIDNLLTHNHVKKLYVLLHQVKQEIEAIKAKFNLLDSFNAYAFKRSSGIEKLLHDKMFGIGCLEESCTGSDEINEEPPSQVTQTQSQNIHPMAFRSDFSIVAAFDLGSTYSGYAFSFKESPNDVKTNRNWTAGSGKLISLKTPTSVLLNTNGMFDSFGFDAEDKYSSLAEEGRHHGWRLFRRFKMVLHNQTCISRSATVTDLEGNTFPAMPIFTMSLKYLQQHLLDALGMSKIGRKETDIRYIVTVPAIWGIAAKQFMREAAIEAGIDDDRLMLALEPEAAAVCCEALGHTLVGKKYMVVDLGGGTADISIHEKQRNGTLKKNIHAPSGGPWGGIYVDANFTKFMTELFGMAAITALQRNDMYDYFDMIRDFEVKKRKFEFDAQKDITFRIPMVLRENSEKHFHQSLSDRLASLKYGKKVFLRGRDKLGVDSSIMQSWFTDPVSKTVNHISSVLKEEQMKNVGLIVLVGGFAECPYVQHRIQKELPGIQLIVPFEAGLAVLKGAVMFGHKPGMFS